MKCFTHTGWDGGSYIFLREERIYQRKGVVEKKKGGADVLERQLEGSGWTLLDSVVSRKSFKQDWTGWRHVGRLKLAEWSGGLCGFEGSRKANELVQDEQLIKSLRFEPN